jgi:hypothetical protein
MNIEQTIALVTWERDAKSGKYFADANDDGWHIVQAGVQKWEVYCNGRLVDTAGSLRDAKFSVGDTVREQNDPELHARREMYRAARAERRTLSESRSLAASASRTEEPA